MGKGVDFTGDGMADVSNSPSTSGLGKGNSKELNGPVELTGDGDKDVGGMPSGSMEGGNSASGGPVEFAGDV